MPRLRIEGLLTAFPKLISSSKQQHTFVETDTVRYVYQPLENGLFLLLITTKSSNIVEDLGTLRLLAKVIPDVVGGLNETLINDNSFELIFAFDEVITVGGYKEDVALSDIRENLQMESHEEQIFMMLEKKKHDDAKKAMEEKANEIKKRQMEALKDNIMGNGSSAAPTSGMQGFGGGGVTPGYEHNSSGTDFMGGGGAGGSSFSYEKPKPVEPIDEGPRIVAKGMKLGGGGGDKKKKNLMAAMAMEDNFSLLSGKKSGGGLGLGLSAASDPVAAAPSTPLTVNLEEKYTVAMNREGGIESCDLKGTLTLTANTDAGTVAAIAVNKSAIVSKCGAGWNFATHPKVDKKNYESKGVLSLKGGKALPVNRPVGVLRWSYSGEDAAPISINCWPEDEGSGSINVNVEFELLRSDMTLSDVNILLPLGTTDPPAVEEIDGQYKHDPSSGMMCWHHDVIDGNNSTGSLEFSIAGSDVDAFFPVQIMFKSQTFMCPIDIVGITSTVNGASIPNNMTRSVVPETYSIS